MTAAASAPLVRLTGLAQTVVLAWGWRRAMIAVVAGAASTLALAPVNIWPVMFFTFPLLVWLIDGAAAARLGGVMAAFVTGWWFGFGYFVTGLYWIGHAFLVDAKTFAWLMPFAVVVFPAGLALLTGLGLALARLLWTRGASRVIALALSLTIAEWVRGHVFTGFPWNTFGYALTGPLALAQGAALLGLWGLTFLTVLVFASPALLADEPLARCEEEHQAKIDWRAQRGQKQKPVRLAEQRQKDNKIDEIAARRGVEHSRQRPLWLC